MRECRTCAFCAQTTGGSLYCAWTDHFVPNHCCDNWKPKQTNADKIRAMTDEELAEWVWGAESAGRAYGPRGKNAWLEWLKQEAGND